MKSVEFIFFNERLTKKLNCIDKKPMTVVCAPMAAGKSMAVKAYLDNLTCNAVWHAITDERLETFVTDFLTQLSLADPEASRELGRIYNGGDESFAPVHIASALKRCDFNKRMFYVLECGQTSDGRIFDFLYQLVCHWIPRFSVVIISRFGVFSDMSKMIDDRVNVISSRYFMLTPSEIVEGFHQYGVELIPEEAALVFRYTNGWIPAVGYVYQHIWQIGKAEVWKSIGRLFDSWKTIAKQPEKLGYSRDQWELLRQLHKRERFSSADLGNAFHRFESDSFPLFLYYNEFSDSYHIHYLLSRVLSDQSENSSPNEDLRADAPLTWREIEDPAISRALTEVDLLLFQYQLQECRHAFESTEYSSSFTVSDMDVQSRVKCELRLRKAALLVFTGQAESAFREMEENLYRCVKAGEFAAAGELSCCMITFRFLLGDTWLKNAEDYSAYMLYRLRSHNDAPRTANLVYLESMILRHIGKTGALPACLETLRTEDSFSEAVRNLMMALACANLGDSGNANACFSSAMEYFAGHDIVLPLLVFSEELRPFIARKKGEGLKTDFFDKVAAYRNQYHRKMKKNISGRKPFRKCC